MPPAATIPSSVAASLLLPALVKQSGSFRLIEAPKTSLKQIQRRIFPEILEKIPAHPAAHGFVKACGSGLRRLE